MTADYTVEVSIPLRGPVGPEGPAGGPVGPEGPQGPPGPSNEEFVRELGEVFVDDFERPDVTGSGWGPSTSGHELIVTGTGASELAIDGGKLKKVGTSGGAAYVWPTLTQPVRRFGCTFTIDQTSGNTQWVGALIISAQAQSLTNMLHIVWDASNVGLADWRNGGTINLGLLREVFSPRLAPGGEYKIEVELIPETNTVVLYTPNGRVLRATCENLDEYYTPHVAFEWIHNASTVQDNPAFTRIWAISGRSVNSARIVNEGINSGQLIDSNKYRENSSYDIPLVNPQSTVANSGSVAWGAFGLRTVHWLTAGSSAVANLAGNVTGMPILFRRTSGAIGTEMENFWRSYLLFKFHFRISGSTASGTRHAVNLGQYWNGNAAGGLAAAQGGLYPSGVGILVKGNALHACVNSGVAGGGGYVESSALMTLASDKFYEITLEYLGGMLTPPAEMVGNNRQLRVYVNGLLLDTLSNGPHDSGNPVCYSVTQASWTEDAAPAQFGEAIMRQLRLSFDQKALH